MRVNVNFKMSEKAANQLTMIADFYTRARTADGFLPPGRVTKTDVVEWLIQKEYDSLIEQGFDVEGKEIEEETKQAN